MKCFLLVGNLRKEILSHERKTNSTALIGENDTHFLECHLPKFNRGSARRDRDWSTALPTDGWSQWKMVDVFSIRIIQVQQQQSPVSSWVSILLCLFIQSVCACVCAHVCICVHVCRLKCWGGSQFMSMVLKTHSVNFLSLAAEVWDSSCSLWLSSQSLLIWAWSLTFSSRSCGRWRKVGLNYSFSLTHY